MSLSNPLSVPEPTSLIEKPVQHRLNRKMEGDHWFSATVINYDADTKLHELQYDEKEKHFFELVIDILLDDLIVEYD